MEPFIFVINLAVFALGIKIMYDDWRTNEVVMWEFFVFALLVLVFKMNKIWLIPNIVSHILLGQIASKQFMSNITLKNIYLFLNLNYLKLTTGFAFLIILIWALKSKRMAPADVLLIFVIFLTTDPIRFMVLMLTASTVGIVVFVLYNRRYIPFLSILIPLWMLI